MHGGVSLIVECPMQPREKEKFEPLLTIKENPKENTKTVLLKFKGDCCQSCGGKDLQPVAGYAHAICAICLNKQQLGAQMVACVKCGKYDACLSCYIRVTPHRAQEHVTIT